MESFATWMQAAVLALVISGAAYRLHALSLSGAVAAIVMGALVVGGGGWWAGIILVTFFMSSSLFSRFRRGTDQQARGSRRDAVQVLANGWPILLGCVLYAITTDSMWLLFGFGGIAAATADTWSSELGRHSISPPRLITTGKVVPTGTSGAVTLIGSGASLIGAVTIAILGAIALEAEAQPVLAFFAITAAGLLGSLIDSLLGASVQERRWCDSCHQATESNPHRCGTDTSLVGGVRGFSNDVVNVACVLTGAIIGLLSGIL